MKKRLLLLSLVLILIPTSLTLLQAAEPIRTQVFSSLVKSLEVRSTLSFLLPPIINLHGEEQIEICFDYLSADYNNMSFRIDHCDANWNPSNISEIEYLNGFNNSPIQDYKPSVNTMTSYWHYSIKFPNSDCQPRLSGNYVVYIYDDFAPEVILLRACFSVCEPQVGIQAEVSSNTDRSFNKELQQVGFSINTSSLSIASLANDLKVRVQQNNRYDNQTPWLQPSQISGNNYQYVHNPLLIFEAGNEYRRFEMTSRLYVDPKIQTYQYHPPYYHAVLYPDEPRTRSYSYDQDQNGHYLIRYSDASDDSQTEADYYIVHFSIPMAQPWLEGSVYLNGQLTYNLIDDNSKMEYNFETKAYEKNMLLKLGHYNYQYLFRLAGSSTTSSARMEGNWWETENEYLIWVYYRPMGERYDRLVGYQRIQSAGKR